MADSEVHPTAIIHDGAVIGSGTSIGPYSIIGPRVVLGAANRIGPHVVIEGHTRIGNNNAISQFASLGSPPQDLKFRGEETLLEIGNNNVMREYVTLQPGTAHGRQKSVIGDGNLFMASSHVGHDSIVGNGNVFANSAAIAGHVIIGNGVGIGGMVGIHQFVRIGDLAYLAAGAMVSQDIAPYCMAHGDHARICGLNVVGLKRKGVAAEDLQILRRAYKLVFLGSGLLKDRIARAQQEWGSNSLVTSLLTFITESERGIAKPRSAKLDNQGESQGTE